MSTEDTGLGPLLRTLRERRLLTQEALAERSGLSVGTVRGLEAGRIRRPRTNSVGLLAEALSLSEPDRASLVGAALAPRPAPRAWGPPAQLPPSPACFTGRDAHLGRLDAYEAAPDRPVAVVLAGPAGAGKTALAVRWAGRVRERFPDGQLFSDLSGRTGDRRRPGAVLGGFLRALDAPYVPSDVDEASALYRSLLADRRVLVVLDDAADARQVRALLPAGPGCLVLVTGRTPLAEIAVREGAATLHVGPLSGAAALDLLTEVLGTRRVRAERPAAEKLAALCGRLPGELWAAAAQLAHHPRRRIASHVASLRVGTGRLTVS